MTISRFIATPAAVILLLLATGCGEARKSVPAAGNQAPLAVVLKTDWYPQGEHGGYYQAVARGLYRRAGLDLTVEPGGPGAYPTQLVAAGKANFALGRSDDVILAVQQGLPLLIVCAFMEQDPQGILVHAESPVKTFADLDGKSVMAMPGSAWIGYIESKHGVKMNLIPLNFGLAQFMADPNFIQQCFVTNEPYFVRKNGGDARALLIADSGYAPYRVVFTNARFAREHPEAVRAFVAASIRGWDEFLAGDDTAAARDLILKGNSSMTSDFIAFSTAEMKRLHLITGDPAKGESTGLITRARLEEQSRLLAELKMIPSPMPVEKFASFAFLPPELRGKAEGR